MADQGMTTKRLRIIVIQDDSEDVESLSNEIKSKYPNHYQFSENAFVVLTSDLPSEISRSLMSYGKKINGRQACSTRTLSVFPDT